MPIARVLAIIVTSLVVCASTYAGQSFDRPRWSPNNQHVALSGENARGVYVYDTTTGQSTLLTDSPSSGYACQWSPDGDRLGYKLLIPQDNGMPLQVPMCYSLKDGRQVALSEAVAAAGVPSFSRDGKVAFTIGRQLHIRDGIRGSTGTCDLGAYANQTPLSPDGRFVAYNNAQDAICLLELATGKSRVLTRPGVACFNPAWSPDGARLLVSTAGGRLTCIEIDAGDVHDLDDGQDASWQADGRSIIYSRIERQDGFSVVAADICTIASDGSGKKTLHLGSQRKVRAPALSPDGKRLLFVPLGDQPQIHQAETSSLGRGGEAASTILDSQVIQAAPAQMVASMTTGTITTATQIRISRTMSYLHQIYDTPDAFDGRWACNASSAIMAMNYYEVLPYWDVTCSTPYAHVSHFGRYVSDIYTFNGVTYSIGSADASGRLGYGGYGYIVRNNWYDTKGYMRDYLINHGVPSAVDWSPTWEKLQAEVNADHPFVLLNSLTTAGHYIVTIGYYDTQRTAVFNDPYGNKNVSYPGYNGAGACYDWPGYNNGYQNLNTVHCFIYARGGSAPAITTQPVTRRVPPGNSTTFTVQVSGLGPISYRWQKNGANLSNAGHYSGTTTATLTISSADAGDQAGYRCVVNNTYGSVTSNPANLILQTADFDHDNDVDVEDFAHLQNCLGIGDVAVTAPACEDADLDATGNISSTDVDKFVLCLSGPNVPLVPGCLALP